MYSLLFSPPPSHTNFTLVHLCKQLPNFPYKPFTASNRIEAFDLLHAQLTAPPPPVRPVVEDFQLSEDGEPNIALPEAAQSPVAHSDADLPTESAPAPVPEAVPVAPAHSTTLEETSAVVDTEFLLLLGGILISLELA